MFTLPAPIADIAYQNKAAIYDLLFKAAAETTLTIAADPKHLGARIGITAVLHTWGSALTHHPHVHMIVPGGGLSPDGERWIVVPAGLLSPRARALAPVPPAVPGDARRGAQGQPASVLRRSRAARRHRAFAAYLAPLRKIEWVVYAKRPFGGPQAVLAYLRATPTASPSPTPPGRRSTSNGVTFKWKDYRDRRAATLQDDDAGHRRVHPPLPDPRAAKGFHRIRHYGLFANGNRAANIARARELLAVPSPPEPPRRPTAPPIEPRVLPHHARAAAAA